MTNLFVRSGISFVDRSEVLTHIGNEKFMMFCAPIATAVRNKDGI